MRTRSELARHLQTLTQALYFRSVDRDELSDEGRVQLRVLEENITLMGWCLDDPDAEALSWADVREAFGCAFRLLWLRLIHHRPPDHQTRSGSREVPHEQ